MAFKGLQMSSLLQRVMRNGVHNVVLEKGMVSALPASYLFSLKSSQTQTLNRFFHACAVQMAGHSKWSNIRHIKAAQDKKKGALGLELSRKVQLCLSRNPETDPKLNTELASLIKTARTNNIPNETIQKTIDRVVALRDVSNISAFDGRGPANTGIVIECNSLKPHHTKSLLQGIVKKYGFSLNSSGADLFEHKGTIDVDLPEEDLPKALEDPENFNIDKYIDIAIEAGAEEVTLEPGEENPVLRFICGPQDLDKVQTALVDAGMNVLSGERSYIPTTWVPVSSEFMEAIGKLTEKLDLFPDVVKYYHNMELENQS